MRKSSWKHLFKTIQKNMVSFLAVSFIAAISIAIYIGLQGGATATLRAADDYFKSQKLHTMEITGAYGITEEDIKEIAGWDAVSVVEGGYSAMVMIEAEKERITVQALSINDEINAPVVVEGTLPEEIDEVAIEERFAMEKGLKVGDTIELLHQGNLVETEFRITAIINQANFCCAKMDEVRGNTQEGLGAAAFYISLPKEAFNEMYYGGRFTKAYLYTESLDEFYTFSEEYETKSEGLLTQFEENAKDLDKEDWTFTVRGDAGDLRAMTTLVNSIYGLSYVMSILFVMVAIIVCYAAISRMIFEQRTLIGAQKALGFKSGEILRHFVIYNLVGAMLGIVLGNLIGVFIAEQVVVSIFSGEFLLPHIPLVFTWKEALIAAAVCIGIFLVTTYIACAKLVRQPAIVLLKDEIKERKKGFFFEKSKAYRSLNLYSRTMIKNVLNDKARMLTTIVGVIGCISLLVVCFSLKMGIENSSKIQFEEYFLYENRLVIDTRFGNTEDFEAVLKEEGVAYIKVQDKVKNFQIEEGKWENGHIVTCDNMAALQDFMVLEDIETGEVAEVPKEGVLVSRKCAEVYDLAEGDTVEFPDAFGERKEFRIVGIIEHYLAYPLFVTTEAHYEEIMGEEADACVFLLKGDIDGLYEAVRDLDGYISLKDNSELQANADQINMVIALCLALAAIMALLVLLNQITMNISQRARELAVMRINGYTLKETKAYIYKDNVVLTAFGLLLGCGCGAGIGYLSLILLEGDVNRYVRAVNPVACLLGVAVGIVFAVIVNIIALRKIHTLNLTNVSGN